MEFQTITRPSIDWNRTARWSPPNSESLWGVPPPPNTKFERLVGPKFSHPINSPKTRKTRKNNLWLPTDVITISVCRCLYGPLIIMVLSRLGSERPISSGSVVRLPCHPPQPPNLRRGRPGALGSDKTVFQHGPWVRMLKEQTQSASSWRDTEPSSACTKGTKPPIREVLL